LVEEAIAGVKHVRSRIPGIVNFAEIERYIVKKPIIEELHESDIVGSDRRPLQGHAGKDHENRQDESGSNA